MGAGDLSFMPMMNSNLYNHPAELWPDYEVLYSVLHSVHSTERKLSKVADLRSDFTLVLRFSCW